MRSKRKRAEKRSVYTRSRDVSSCAQIRGGRAARRRERHEQRRRLQRRQHAAPTRLAARAPAARRAPQLLAARLVDHLAPVHGVSRQSRLRVRLGGVRMA